MLPYYNVTGERNFYAISVGKYSEFSDVECYQEDAYQLADGFKFQGKFSQSKIIYFTASVSPENDVN